MVVYDHRQLISSAPKMSLYPVGMGVWLIPHPGSHAPPNLFFYWQRGSDHVIVSLPVCQCVSRLVCLHVYQCLSVCLVVSVSVCLSVCLSTVCLYSPMYSTVPMV